MKKMRLLFARGPLLSPPYLLMMPLLPTTGLQTRLVIPMNNDEISRSFILDVGAMYLCLSQIAAFIAGRSDGKGIGEQGKSPRSLTMALQILPAETRDR